MKRTKIFFRRLEVNHKIAELQKELKKVEEEWEEIAKDCNHEITITTWKMEAPEEMLISKIRPRTYCLLCDEHLSPKRYSTKEEIKKIKKSVNIDLQEYPNICNKWGIRHYIANLDEIYKEVNADFKNMTEQEIGEIMKKRMDAIEAFI